MLLILLKITEGFCILSKELYDITCGTLNKMNILLENKLTKSLLNVAERVLDYWIPIEGTNFLYFGSGNTKFKLGVGLVKRVYPLTTIPILSKMTFYLVFMG